jgi:hypothetical protein
MKGNEVMLQIIKSALRLNLSAACAAAVIVACATGLPEKAHAQTKIVEGFVSHGALQWPEYIASEFGWFKENGIDLDMLVVGAGASQQVAAGTSATAASPTSSAQSTRDAAFATFGHDKRLAELGAKECLGELRDRLASAGGQQSAFLRRLSRPA